MKDVLTVLRQKEQELERVWREIRALITVIPLLEDDQSATCDVMNLLSLISARSNGRPSSADMTDLEDYYPFVRAMRMSERR